MYTRVFLKIYISLINSPHYMLYFVTMLLGYEFVTNFYLYEKFSQKFNKPENISE